MARSSCCRVSFGPSPAPPCPTSRDCAQPSNRARCQTWRQPWEKPTHCLLSLAAFSGQVEVVRYMLEHGASLYAIQPQEPNGQPEMQPDHNGQQREYNIRFQTDEASGDVTEPSEPPPLGKYIKRLVSSQRKNANSGQKVHTSHLALFLGSAVETLGFDYIVSSSITKCDSKTCFRPSYSGRGVALQNESSAVAANDWTHKNLGSLSNSANIAEDSSTRRVRRLQGIPTKTATVRKTERSAMDLPSIPGIGQSLIQV